MSDIYKKPAGIAWDDSLITGNAMVDMQHQRIFDRLGDLVRYCEEGSDTEKLNDTLVFLLNHVASHFFDEEALQIEYGYPDLENHQHLHNDFRDTVDELVERFHHNGSSSDLSEDVNTILVRWLVNHIQREDKKLSEHIKRVSAEET
ncbi:MAG: hemerythrin family protein [Symbiobacteriaceae bacterium]|nr:hemerythrin family protein [Symbiobacteriaceae bacterium]